MYVRYKLEARSSYILFTFIVTIIADRTITA